VRKRLSKYKIDRILIKQLVSLYEIENKPNFVFMLLGSSTDPRDGSIYYTMPSYETRNHLPFGDEYKIGSEVKFEDITILMSEKFKEQAEGGVICLIDDLIRILPESEFEDRFIVEGVSI